MEQFPDINKVCNVASCWIYEYIGILLGAHPILHISRIRVKEVYTYRFSIYLRLAPRVPSADDFYCHYLGYSFNVIFIFFPLCHKFPVLNKWISSKEKVLRIFRKFKAFKILK